jgi:hypothetical protein
MALVSRQESLFASEDWRVAYKAFSQVNFQAYDYDTIRSAMVDYVRVNLPEFNDFIESSEFIAIIELLAYLSQSLAFRVDLNSRENFLETAERRDSVFKLAKMLGYTPKRNQAAQGLMKIVAVRTSEPITDSVGTALNNKNIFWDDANNPDSYEQFITVLNSAMGVVNRFGSPAKSSVVMTVPTDLYLLNTPSTAPFAYGFPITTAGITRSYEVINPDFENGLIVEKHPDLTNPFGIMYRNDSRGLASPNTGFFVYFKQGTLTFKDFDFTTPIEGRQEDLLVSNINETDVYLQEINTQGVTLNKWIRIPNTVGQTLSYNSQAFGTRNLYAVDNVENRGIKFKFPDGSFGAVPVGIFRAWYRVSDPTRFVIQPSDVRSTTVSIPYTDSLGRAQTISLTFRLEQAVNSSSPAEPLSSIKEKASQVFYTQNRMVSAQDYNVFPLGQSTEIVKLKAINRTHAGHSRYIDVNDPTGSFQNVETYAEDGYVIAEKTEKTETVIINENYTVDNFLETGINTSLESQALNNYIYRSFRKEWQTVNQNKFFVENLNVRWNPQPVDIEGATGYMTETFSSGTVNIMTNNIAQTRIFQPGNFVKFVDPNDPSDFKWVRIVSVSNAGAIESGLVSGNGPWLLSASVPSQWRAQELIVSLRKRLTGFERATISEEMFNSRSFGIGYEPSLDSWYVISLANLNKNGPFSVENAGNQTGQGLDSSWLIRMEHVPDNNFTSHYHMTVRGENYVIQSKNTLKFYNLQTTKVEDSFNRANQDTITLPTLNTKPGDTEILEWADKNNDGVPESWLNRNTGTYHTPVSYAPNIPLKTRSTNWTDVKVEWQSNFGLLQGNGLDNTQVLSDDQFVGEARIRLNVYFDDGVPAGLTSNVTVANASGQLTRIPGSIEIPFTNATFGYNLFDANGNITYKQLQAGSVEIFNGNTSITNGSVTGNLRLESANATAQTGVLIYDNLELNNYHRSTDISGRISSDKILITYVSDKEKLDQPIVWRVVESFKYSDGYTDNYKVIVAPEDTDGDLVPDRPLQFAEYVDDDDIVLYEYFTDFDGYTYDRPVTGVILDYRGETSIQVSFLSSGTIAPGSVSRPSVLDTVNWLLVDDISIAQPLENNLGKARGIKVYSASNDTVYRLTSSSTSTNEVRLSVTNDFFARSGRGMSQATQLSVKEPCIIRWQHVAPRDVRIDPSISNVIEMIVLTQNYLAQIKRYLSVPGLPFPLEPTPNELKTQFASLDEYKAASDTIIMRSGKFKILFGSDAEPGLQATFRVVKLTNQLSDNEIRSRVISAMSKYFSVENWEFGETFYFTELSSYIHQQLGSAIGSIVILPKTAQGRFGDLFQVKAESNELFISTAKATDIELIDKISSQTLRTDR